MSPVLTPNYVLFPFQPGAAFSSSTREVLPTNRAQYGQVPQGVHWLLYLVSGTLAIKLLLV